MWLPPDPAPVTPAKASEDNSPEEEDADQAHSKFRKYRTELCKFWQNGACTRGFQCTFAHSVGELRDSASTERGARQVPEFPSRKSEERPGSSSKYKTAFCRYWQQGNSCKRGTDCTFAHSPSELRLLADTPAEGPSAEWTDAPRKYKTQFCRYWQTGSCTWGSDCTFAHSPKELRQEGQRTEGQRTEASKTPQYGPGSFRPGYLPPEIGDMSPLSGQWKDLRDGSETKGSGGADGLAQESFRERFESLSLSLGQLGFADPLKSTGPALQDAFVPAAPRLPAAPPLTRLAQAGPPPASRRRPDESNSMESSPDASKVPLPTSPLMPSPTGSNAGFFLPFGVLDD